MGVEQFLLGLVVAVAALVASSGPVAAFGRTRDPRFLFVTVADLGLMAVGALATYGAIVARAPTYTQVPPVPLALVAVAALGLLLVGLFPRSGADR